MTRATPTCRATHCGGRAWTGMRSSAVDPRVKHPATEGASEPLARLADMDAMGVDRYAAVPDVVR